MRKFINLLKRFRTQMVGCLMVCGGWSLTAQAESLRVLTSVRPLALMVQGLVDERAQVEVLVPANADPHNWSMRVSDRQRLESADWVVWLGAEFERFLARPMGQRDAARQLIVGDLADLRWPEVVEHPHRHDHHHGHEGRDLHLWLDPHNVAVVMTAMAQRLAILRPAWKTDIEARLAEQLAQLRTAEAAVAAQLAPLKERGFAVHHDAFGHFVQAFGLRQVAAVNQLPEQRLSARRLNELRSQMRGARCLVVERTSVQAQRLADTAGVPLVVADALALDAEIQGYGEFLRRLGDAFYRCLAGTVESES